MTVRKRDLDIISSAIHDLHMVVELHCTDANVDYETRKLNRAKAFLSASRTIGKVLERHNLEFDLDRFIASCTPKHL